MIVCDPAEARTLDPQIKSLLLYQLSYGVISKKMIQEASTYCYPTWIRTKTNRIRICRTTVILSGNKKANLSLNHDIFFDKKSKFICVLHSKRYRDYSMLLHLTMTSTKYLLTSKKYFITS